VIATGTPSRAKLYVWVPLALLAIAVALWPARSWYRNHPHGNPDPRGERVSYLAQVARQTVPVRATGIQLHLKKSSWDPGGCEGGAPGWSRMEADQVFRTSDNAVSEIDAAMVKEHWRSVPVQGGTAVREYEPVSDNGYDDYGWLFSSTDRNGTSWELDLSAAPSEVPTHAC
jgi:hypothetical protein